MMLPTVNPVQVYSVCPLRMCVHYPKRQLLPYYLKRRQINSRSTSPIYDREYYERLAISKERWYDSYDELWCEASSFELDLTPYNLQDEVWYETRSGSDIIDHQETWYDASASSNSECGSRTLSYTTQVAYIATIGKVLGSSLKVDSTSAAYQSEAYLCDETCRYKVPIVIDTGCSVSVSPCLRDFIGPLKQDGISEMHGLSGSTSVKGVGVAEWKIRDIFNNVATIQTKCYYIPQAEVRLFSTQTYFQEER